ncbi:hypothetical protein [Leifsonia sp. SIMBA_070]|uniref:hypothetical protein n=1 Tax=Leifsonia sp. SIMBA_070 TaxID=3085810 RepID=UPI00397DC484
MSDTSGLPNTDAEGVPAEDKPERFEEGQAAVDTSEEDVAAAEDDGSNNTPGGDRDAQAAEPAETDAGQANTSSVSEPGETGIAPEGAEDVTAANAGTAADTGSDQPEAPPADFDPADQPSNPDLVGHSEPPD